MAKAKIPRPKASKNSHKCTTARSKRRLEKRLSKKS